MLREFINKNFKSIELLDRVTDSKTRLALDKCFLNKPLVVLAFASPLVRLRQHEGLTQMLEMDLLDY
jgi:hypothetical protein